MRIDFTIELLLNDMGSVDVIKILTAKYPISSRQALRYCYIAHAALEVKGNINLQRKKAWYYARKLRSIRDMDPKAKKTPAGVIAINTVLDSLAAMDGIPTKITRISGDKDNPLEVNHIHKITDDRIDYEAMPTELLESYVNLHLETQKYLKSSQIEDAEIVE